MAYIEREALLKVLRGSAVAKYPASFAMGLFAAADEVSKLPAADVVPVVHCRDCVYNGLDSMPHTKDKCYRLMLTCFKVKPEDFCAWGRKKDGE